MQLTERNLCTGCHSCSSVCLKQCIDMVVDPQGFLYPKTDEHRCIKCNLCRKVCPVLHKATTTTTPIAYAAYNKQEDIRQDSSSGGVFTLLAETVLAQGGVVFGACFDKQFQVEHGYVETVTELDKLRRSKYVQSKIGNAYVVAKAYLESGGMVLFTGTPCQIGGLKRYLQADYDNLICQDLICHGVPSPKLWSKYIAFREHIANVSTQKVNFRCKKEGWKQYSVLFEFQNSTEYCQSAYKDLMMKAFLSNVCLRASCYNCSFKTLYRESDITLADFWGIQSIMPEMDDDKGTSLVIVNSEKGSRLFNAIQEQIIYKGVDLNEAIQYNLSMVQSVLHNPKRQGFFSEIDSLPIDRLIHKYCSDGYIVKCKRRVRKILLGLKSRIPFLRCV